MYRFIVESAEMVTPSTLQLTLTLEKGEPLFTFVPGQYAGISFVRRGRPSAVRCFSIMSSPTQQDVLQFGIRVGGKFTRRLASLKAGDSVYVHGPYGHFVLDAPRQPQVVMIAGGIGITPFMSMIRFASITQSPSTLCLLASARNQQEAPFVSELRDLIHSNARLKVAYMISDGPTDTLDGFVSHKGRISPEIISEHLTDDAVAFICGPPAFMKAVIAMLRSAGVPNSRIITEAFTQGSGRQTSKIRSWQFNIYALGALGTAAASIVVMANDLLKTLPDSILPSTLTSTASESKPSRRQSDLDTLVNNLAPLASWATESPGLVKANKEVADAEAKVAEVNAQNAANSGTAAVVTPKKTTASTPVSTPPSTAPKPQPAPTPVCTTSASGVTTCQ